MSAGRLMVCAVVCCKSCLSCKLKLTAENRRLVFKVQIFVPHTAKKANISKKLQFTRVFGSPLSLLSVWQKCEGKKLPYKIPMHKRGRVIFHKIYAASIFLILCQLYVLHEINMYLVTHKRYKKMQRTKDEHTLQREPIKTHF